MSSLLHFCFLPKMSRGKEVFKMFFKTVFLNTEFINGPVTIIKLSCIKFYASYLVYKKL